MCCAVVEEYCPYFIGRVVNCCNQVTGTFFLFTDNVEIWNLGSPRLISLVQSVLQMGFRPNSVIRLVQKKFQQMATSYPSLSELVWDLLQAQQDQSGQAKIVQGMMTCPLRDISAVLWSSRKAWVFISFLVPFDTLPSYSRSCLQGSLHNKKYNHNKILS